MSSTSIRNIRVRAAAPGLRVPYERHPRKYIAGNSVVEVPATAYYLRRITDGELVQVDVKKPARPKADKGINQPAVKES